MGVSAPVQVLNYQGSAATSGSATGTVTASVPVGALLVVVVHRYNSSGVNAVSVSGGGNTFTRAIGADQGSNHSDIFSSVVTSALTSGVDDIVASVAAGAYVWKVTAFYVTGHDAFTPVKADTAIGGSTGSVQAVNWSDTIASAANGDLVVAAVTPGNTADITTPPTTYTMLSRLNGTGAGTGMTLTNAVGSGGETALPPAMTLNTTLAKSAAAIVIQAAATSPQTFSYTGAQQALVVPAGVTQVTIDAQGAEGYFFSGGTHRGGGRAVGTFTVTPGETLYVNVGGQPDSAVTTGGWNGGGNGGLAASSFGRGGGGASDVRRGGTALANRLLAAGGAGGGGNGNASGGGIGGGATGGAATGGGAGGAGGTQAAGGASGGGGGVAGSQGVGGAGGGGAPSNGGGGGGGGWYGGGGGSASNSTPGGGGGGSNGPTAALSVDTQNYRLGHGQVIVSWVDAVVTGTMTAAPVLTAVATVALTRTGTITAAPALSATAFARFVRTGDIAAAPVLTATAFSDNGTRSGTITAAPSLSATAVGRLTRTADLSVAPVLTATQTSQVSPARTASLSVAPVLTAVAVISKQTRTGTITVSPVMTGEGVPDYVGPAGPPVVGNVDMRLRAYVPNGATLGLLPAPTQYRCAMPLNDIPALTMTYGVGVPRAELLGQPLELAVELSGDGGNSWTEPPDGRFLYLTDGRDPSRTADEYAAEAKGYIWRCTKAKVLASGALNGEGRREFNAIGPGVMLQTLWSEAQARGALQGMTLVGGGLTDAAGNTWPVPVNRSYDVGQDYLSVLLDLEASGFIDFRTEGRTVKVYVQDVALSTDRTVTPAQVSLTPLQVTEAPFRRTWEGLADSITVVGDEGTTVEVVNGGALRPWGRWEDFVTAGGVSDVGTLTILGTRWASTTAEQRIELTHGLALGIGQTPLLDFYVGDYVWSQPSTGAKARYRIRQVTLEKEGRTVQGNVVLNDRFLERDIRQRRAIDAITSSASSGSTGPLPTPPGPDILQPAAVASLTGSTATYVDAGGATWGQVSLDWPDVTTNLDGTPLTDLDHYEVQAKKGDNSSTQQYQRLADSMESRASLSNYVPGDLWTFRVRAVDSSDNRGPWSPVLTATIAADTTGPVKPSTPTATSRLGNGAITWNGLAVSGLPMDADFSFAAIHLSTVNGFTWSAANRMSTMAKAETVQVGPLTMGATYYGRLVPYDTSGNAGTPSDQFSFVVAALVDVSNFPDDAMNTLYARTAHFISLDADQVTANGAAIGFLETGTIQGGIFETTAGGEFRTAADPSVSGGVRVRGTDGFKAYGNKGVGGGPIVQTVSIDPTTGLITAQGGSFTGVDVTGSLTAGVAGSSVAVNPSAGFSGEPGITWTRSGRSVSMWLNSAGKMTFTNSAGDGVIEIAATEVNIPTILKVSALSFYSAAITPINTPPNLRLGDDGLVYKSNTTTGPNDSGGTGFRLVRTPNT